jgi:hypothetical protein
MKNLIALILICLMIPSGARACDCESQGEFLTVAPKSKLTALVKVTKFLTFKGIYDETTPMSMEVEIIEVYKGTETRKHITVWGDDGALCRPYLSIFKEGNYYVIAFEQAGIRETEKPTDYAISICGDFWLHADIENNNATGSVSKTLNKIAFTDLRKRLALKKGRT